MRAGWEKDIEITFDLRYLFSQHIKYLYTESWKKLLSETFLNQDP